MSECILQILMLTLLFSLCGGCVLIFRRMFVGGSGRTLKRLWAVVLILSVVPLYILPITLPRKGQQKDRLAEWLAVHEAELVDRVAERIAPNVGQETTVSPDVVTDVAVTANGDAEAVPMIYEMSKRERAMQWLKIAQCVALGAWLLGVIGFLIANKRGKRNWVRSLRQISQPCRNEAWIQLLQKSKERVGVGRPIELLVVDAALPSVSPCLIGWRKPKLYIHASHLNDPLGTEEIFIHELQHLRSLDAFCKNIACMVLSIHWFNPITYLIWPRLLEDFELSCDSRTLDVLGEERRISYMNTILNIAATTQSPKRAGHAAQFFCEPSGKQTLKRRYRNMSNKRLKPIVRITAVCIAMTMVFACVGCQLVGKKKNTLHLLTPLTEEIVRFYYGLSLEDEVTQEMLDGVTSLHVYRDMTVVDAVRRAKTESEINAAEELPFKGQRYTIEEIGDFIIVDFEVNYKDTEGESFAAARNQALSANSIGCMNYIRRNYMETVILPKVESTFEGYVDHNGKESGEYRYKQFKAYWVLKDQNILTNDRQKEAIITAFPGCGDYPYYVFDPTASTAEWMRAYIIYAHAGLLTNRIIDTDKIDPAMFEVFPNLTDLKITGLTEIRK